MTARVNDDGKLEFSRPVSWTALALLLSIFSSLALVFMWVGKIGERVEQNATSDHLHHNDPSLHTPYPVRVKHFWTRVEGERAEDAIREADVRQRAIMAALARIEERINSTQ